MNKHPIQTLPKNKRVLLLEVVGPMEVYDEDNNLIKKDAYEKNWVVGHYDSVFGIITYPLSNRPTNSRFTHWAELPSIN